MKKINDVFHLFVSVFLNFYVAAGNTRSFCVFIRIDMYAAFRKIDRGSEVW